MLVILYLYDKSLHINDRRRTEMADKPPSFFELVKIDNMLSKWVEMKG